MKALALGAKNPRSQRGLNCLERTLMMVTQARQMTSPRRKMKFGRSSGRGGCSWRAVRELSLIMDQDRIRRLSK